MQDVDMSVEGFNGVFLRGVGDFTNWWWWCKMEMNIIIRHLTTYHSIPLEHTMATTTISTPS